jgi:hypothetical protein
MMGKPTKHGLRIGALMSFLRQTTPTIFLQQTSVDLTSTLMRACKTGRGSGLLPASD